MQTIPTVNGVTKDNGSESVDAKGVDSDKSVERSEALAKSENPYPYHDLREAERVAAAVAEAGGTEASDDEVLKKLSLASKTSRSWTYRLSSAKEFGLVSKSGRGDSTRVVLTPLGRRLQMPEGPAETQAARMAAFLTPSLYQQLVRRYGGMPLPESKGLANVLVRDFGVLPSVAQQAADAFLESARHAGAVSSTGRLQVSATVTEGPAPREPSTETPGAPQPPPPPAQALPTGQVIEVQPGFSVYTYPLRPNLKITIALPDDLTSKDIARLKKFMETLLPDIDEAATPGSASS